MARRAVTKYRYCTKPLRGREPADRGVGKARTMELAKRGLLMSGVHPIATGWRTFVEVRLGPQADISLIARRGNIRAIPSEYAKLRPIN